MLKLPVFKLLLVMMLVGGTVKADEQTKKLADWIRVVSCPQKVKVGEEVVIKISVSESAKGKFLGADMHFFRGPSYGGFMTWSPVQKIEHSGEYTVTFKVSAKDGMTHVGVLFYLGQEKGYKNREKSVWLKGIEVEQ